MVRIFIWREKAIKRVPIWDCGWIQEAECSRVLLWTLMMILSSGECTKEVLIPCKCDVILKLVSVRKILYWFTVSLSDSISQKLCLLEDFELKSATNKSKFQLFKKLCKSEIENYLCVLMSLTCMFISYYNMLSHDVQRYIAFTNLLNIIMYWTNFLTVNE